MMRGSPALRRLFPEPIAQPSTPKEPMYFLDHWLGGVAIDGFRGVAAGEVVMLIKLFKVGARGRFARGLVLMRPTGLGLRASRLDDTQDPSKYMLTALSRLPSDTASSLWRMSVDRSSFKTATSCSEKLVELTFGLC